MSEWMLGWGINFLGWGKGELSEQEFTGQWQKLSVEGKEGDVKQCLRRNQDGFCDVCQSSALKASHGSKVEARVTFSICFNVHFESANLYVL